MDAAVEGDAAASTREAAAVEVVAAADMIGGATMTTDVAEADTAVVMAETEVKTWDVFKKFRLTLQLFLRQKQSYKTTYR